MRSLACFILVAGLLVLGGCAETHDSVSSKMVSNFEEVAKILEGVKDEASAKAAAAKLQAKGDEMQKIKAAVEKLGEPDAATQQKLREKYERRMEEVMAKVMKESMRIAMNPTLGKHLQDSLGKLGM